MTAPDESQTPTTTGGRLKAQWKKHDVAIVLGGLYLTTIFLTGTIAGQTARRETMKIIKDAPMRIVFPMSEKFLQDVRNIPAPSMSYLQKP